MLRIRVSYRVLYRVSYRFAARVAYRLAIKSSTLGGRKAEIDCLSFCEISGQRSNGFGGIHFESALFLFD